MHDLRLVGVHEDGEHLVLSGPDGEQFLLTVDEALRAAVRRDRAHLGQLQIQMSGDFRPREVQAQIRAGATPEEIAERSGWPLDRVRRYESAVLAEREHIAELGRGVTLRRRGSDTTPPTLSARVEQRLAARGVNLQDNVWDSWRADGGPWMLTLRFTAGGREREARWLFDLASRTVTAQDDEALWLSEDEKPPAAPLAAPHLAAVPTVNAAPAAADNDLNDLYDVEAEGGLSLPEPIALDAPSAVDLVGAMRQRRHGRRRQSADEMKEGPARRGAGSTSRPEQEPLELEPLIFDPSLLGDPPAPHPFPFPERLRDPEAGSGATEGDGPDERDAPADEAPKPPRNFGPPPSQPSSSPAAAPKTAATATPAPVAPDPSTHHHRRSRRASVPSWDEIMFGGKRD